MDFQALFRAWILTSVLAALVNENFNYMIVGGKEIILNY